MGLNLLKNLALLLLFVANAGAQEINQGARIAALGNSGVALQDVWSMQSNQAGLASLENPTLAISYQSNYLNTEISTQSAVFIYPVKNNVVGLSFQNYGITAYSEQKIGLAYAKRFGKSVFTAININAHQVKIAQYGAALTYSVEAGIQFKPSSRLLIGSHIANPNKSAFDKQVETRVPTVLSIGASYQVSDKVAFSGGLFKDLDWLTDARFGLEYNLADWLSLRGGLNLNPFRQFAGLGCKYQHFRVDLAAASHPVLGYSPQISLGYEF